MAITTRETTATGVTNKGAPLTNAEVDTNFVELQQGKIELTDLSVTTNPQGTAALSYDNLTGSFSYTPPDLSPYLTSEVNDLTVSVTWANVPDVNITQSSVTQHQAALSITESQISDLQSYLTAEANDLTTAVTWANVPDANITQSSVTQHEAALSIVSTQVSDFSEAVDDEVNTLLQAGLGVDLTYDDVNNELTIDSNHVEVNCTNQTGSLIPAGTPVYQTGVSGNNITIAPADADDAAKMPAIGLTTSAIADAAEGTIVILGVVNGLNTSAFLAGDTVYVSTTAGALTTTAPSGETGLIQNFGRVLKVNASSGSIAVMGAGRANAVPNLNDGNVFIGNASNKAETRALVEADISDLQAYLTAETDPVFSASAAAGITATNISNWNTAYGWGDHSTQGYLTSFTETNDLTAAVTWANVPDANITQTSVTQHQAALSVTESQISDLQSYLTVESDTLDSVSGRGASTTNSLTVGGLHVNSTDAVEMPTGTDAQRPTPTAGMLRFNTTSTSFEGYDGSAWGDIGGGGGATEDAFYENSQTLAANVTISAGRNAMTTGPLTVGTGFSVTIESGCRVVVI